MLLTVDSKESLKFNSVCYTEDNFVICKDDPDKLCKQRSRHLNVNVSSDMLKITV